MSSLFFQHLVSAVSSNSLEALDVTAEQAGSQDGSKHGSEQQPGAAAAAPRPSGAHAAADAVADGNSKLQRNSTNNQKSLEHRLAVHWNWAAASKGAARIGRVRALYLYCFTFSVLVQRMDPPLGPLLANLLNLS